MAESTISSNRDSGGNGPPPDAVRAQLDRICGSPEFAEADRIKDFLRFVVEETLAGRPDRLKGYTIAVEVFGRDESFDPQTNPLVRVEAGRLRRRLREFYLTEGRDHPVYIEIPKGSYIPAIQFSEISMAAEANAGFPSARGTPRSTMAPPRRAITSASVSGSAPATILVVDDEPDLKALMLQRFRSRVRDGDISFLFANDGEEALDVLMSTPGIDLVLTDINMPRMDGLTLLDHLEEVDPLLKAVVVSAYGDMKNIRTAMNRGAFDFITKPINFDDLNATIDKTLAYLSILRDAAKEHDQLESLRGELAIARRMQESIVPESFPVKERFLVFANTVPAREVSGDFYDVFPLPDGRWAFVIADVSGRGVPAALYMAIVSAVIKTSAMEGPPAAECVARVNEFLCRHAGGGLPVALLFGVYHADSGRVVYCNAGHNLPYRISEDGTVELPEGAPGPPVGVLPGQEFTEEDLTLSPGESLCFYTSGVPGAFDANRRQFSQPRLEEVLSRGAELTPRDLVQSVLDEVTGFIGEADRVDDLTCLVFKRLA